MIRWFFAAMCGMAICAWAQEAKELSRYQVILERMPFGQVGTSSGAIKGPEFAQRFVFVGQVSGITNEVSAIIQDLATKRTYFKSPGEMIEDVKVVRVDRVPPKLLLQKGLETASLLYLPRATVPPAPGVAPSPPGVVPPTHPPVHGEQPSGIMQRRMPFRR